MKNTFSETKKINNQKLATDLSIDLFNETMRNQDLPNNFTIPIVNESNIFISENTKMFRFPCFLG